MRERREYLGGDGGLAGSSIRDVAVKLERAFLLSLNAVPRVELVPRFLVFAVNFAVSRLCVRTRRENEGVGAGGEMGGRRVGTTTEAVRLACAFVSSPTPSLLSTAPPASS